MGRNMDGKGYSDEVSGGNENIILENEGKATLL